MRASPCLRSTRLGRLTALCLLVTPLALGACKGDSGDPDPDPDPDPSFWLVGDGGTMFGVSVGGEPSTYPLELDEDLVAITCLGEATAWVAGTGGTVLRSRDAGASWDAITLPDAVAEVDWSGLAAAEASLEGVETVWFVGAGGAVAQTRDGGSTWTTRVLDSGDLSGVATRAAGDRAFAVSDAGEIWRLDEGGASTLVHVGAGPLWAVAMASHDDRIAAVGGAGQMLHSSDGGETWATTDLPTGADLFAVRVAGHEDLRVAVGRGGVVVRVEAGLAEVSTVGEGLDLYGLHLREDGRGQAVGAAGLLIQTEDSGLTWTERKLPASASLRAVDDFHDGAHF